MFVCIEKSLAYWNGNIIEITTFGVVSDINFIKLLAFPFLYCIWNLINLVVDCCHSYHVYNFCVAWLLCFKGFLLVDGEIMKAHSPHVVLLWWREKGQHLACDQWGRIARHIRHNYLPLSLCITVKSHECHAILDPWQTKCLLYSLFN